MKQNTQLKIEFFELCQMLNKSNLRVNQKTEILFFIDTQGYQSILYATTNKIYKMQLAFKGPSAKWEPCGFSNLSNLERELKQLLDTFDFKKLNPAELTKKIKLFIFQNIDES